VKNGIALVVALILGVLGFAAMYVVMSRPQGTAAIGEPEATVRVVVAGKNLKAGTKLDPTVLDVKDIPADYVSSVHIEESQKTSLLGRTLRVAVKQGEPVLALSVESTAVSAPAEIEGGLSYPDTHAVSIALDAPGSVAGLIKPGQKVDVIGTFDIKIKYLVPMGGKTDNDETITRTVMLMQNRTVLAVDVRTNARYEGDPKEAISHVVTLAVTPDEALKLASMQAKGRGHLALRNRKDGTTVTAAPVGALDLLGGKER
jgi:pilus assembly protein CpaB